MTADPDAARANYERFGEVGGRIPDNPQLRETLDDVFGGSPFLSDILIRNPEYIGWLGAALRTERTKSRSEFLEAARAAMQGGLLELHRFHRREILRIGARDLSGRVEMRDITNEISWLSDAITQMGFELASLELEERYGPTENRFAIIGVGKLGGEELNFSSDIDVIYIYSDELSMDRSAKLARRITEILTEHTSEGAFYRVDLRLRPEGARGPVASAIRTLQTYYDSWGETFERIALTKARIVAGHEDIGERFMNLIEPFVYRKYLDFAAIDEIRDIKRRIDQQVEKSVGIERHVKLGRGGIREVEFFVQALQVLYGGEIKDIRVRSTLTALDRLEEAHLIERAVARRLREAYIFLRNLEHKLQIVHQLQTHEIPEEPGQLEQCARRMHMPLESFQSELDSHRAAVHQTFQDLFAGKTRVEEGVAGNVHRFVNHNLDVKATREWLASLGFEDLVQSEHNLELLRDAPAFGHSPTKMRNLLANVLTPLIESTHELIRPAAVLNGFEKIAARVGAREAFFTSLLENPKSIARLARLFALADYLSDILFESPELADFLIDDARLGRPLRNPLPAGERKHQEFHAGSQLLFGVIPRRRVSRLLTQFAERELGKLIPEGARVAIFAAGKFGEREMNFRSDLDVMAFYEGDYDPALHTVEALVKRLSAQFKVDLRLRPEGKKGSLVWPPERYREYLQDRAETWERMALTKARFVGGDVRLGRRVQHIIETFVYEQPFERKQVEEMNAIRVRMENELSRETETAWDLKVGRGGIVDIEFLVEYRQIQENVRIPNTVTVMKCLRMDLLQEYEFLRTVESMLRLWSPIATTRIEAKDTGALARMLNVTDFVAEYLRVTEGIRRKFITGPGPSPCPLPRGEG